MDKQLQPNNHKKHDSPLALSVSIEDEGIIRELPRKTAASRLSSFGTYRPGPMWPGQHELGCLESPIPQRKPPSKRRCCAHLSSPSSPMSAREIAHTGAGAI